MNRIELLIQNTKLLGKAHNQIDNIADKFEILIQLKENLEILAAELDQNEFEASLGQLNESVNKKWNKLTDRSLYENLLERFDKVTEKLKSPSTSLT